MLWPQQIIAAENLQYPFHQSRTRRYGGTTVKAGTPGSFFRYSATGTEEEGVGVVAGQYVVGGMRGAIFMPTSGVGNAINALASLAIPYQIPLPR